VREKAAAQRGGRRISPGKRLEPSGQEPREGRFAIAIGAQERDPIVGIEP